MKHTLRQSTLSLALAAGLLCSTTWSMDSHAWKTGALKPEYLDKQVAEHLAKHETR